MLAHLPPLGFPIPSQVATRGDAPALYRYDKLEYITKLQREGEIFLRCASTEDSAGAARNDSNELCISLSLPAEDLTFEGDPLEIQGSPKVVNLKIHQKTDYFMFCLSLVYDWRLFGDFAPRRAQSAASDSFSRSAAHFSKASSAGHNACPHLVKQYSTLGGT